MPLVTSKNRSAYAVPAESYRLTMLNRKGFTKDLTLPRSIWAGYIKDYEGATIMQCTMLPRISYLQASHMLLRQKQLILNKIREKSHSHVVHSGANLFRGRDKVHPSDVEALRAHVFLIVNDTTKD